MLSRWSHQEGHSRDRQPVAGITPFDKNVTLAEFKIMVKLQVFSMLVADGVRNSNYENENLAQLLGKAFAWPWNVRAGWLGMLQETLSVGL